MSKILGIETSCDETAAAVLEGTVRKFGRTEKLERSARQEDGRVRILSNVIASSASLQEKYGGVIPEQAAREQLKSIIPVIKEALEQAKITYNELDAIAVTQGPGLIGSLLIGVETAKTLAWAWDKPLIGINHLVGHFYANWVQEKGEKVGEVEEEGEIPRFPCIGLLVSGGHSDIVLFEDHNKFRYLGGTRDDAAGECFDKSARLLGLPYPGGPLVAKLAAEGDPKAFDLPRPLIGSGDLDFSFSGLKTAVANIVKFGKEEKDWKDQKVKDFCASLEMAIVDCLCKKTIKAAQINNIDQIIVSGGVAANSTLKRELRARFPGKVFVPPPFLCTDNAVMIAASAFYNFNPIEPTALQADPSLSLG